MLVVRVNDFSIPSDENDYDELVAFADTMASIEQFEAIPKADIQKALKEGSKDISENVLAIVREEYISKADYENRLKADIVAMLTDIQLEIEEKATEICDDGWWLTYNNLIQQKIDALKGGQDGKI